MGHATEDGAGLRKDRTGPTTPHPGRWLADVGVSVPSVIRQPSRKPVPLPVANEDVELDRGQVPATACDDVRIHP